MSLELGCILSELGCFSADLRGLAGEHRWVPSPVLVRMTSSRVGAAIVSVLAVCVCECIVCVCVCMCCSSRLGGGRLCRAHSLPSPISLPSLPPRPRAPSPLPLSLSLHQRSPSPCPCTRLPRCTVLGEEDSQWGEGEGRERARGGEGRRGGDRGGARREGWRLQRAACTMPLRSASHPPPSASPLPLPLQAAQPHSPPLTHPPSSTLDDPFASLVLQRDVMEPLLLLLSLALACPKQTPFC